ncbi:type II secretion system minor pseudopilin GspK [Deferrisoma camini]|uniref:type II secretion system minor pseudopilin GspK n=1 Tax=Deferrisoma camini TaxID=1035120 RepID=UPI00046D50EE|nr:type II secretion system minor pseudopilin GspK [Deferrisoma camini]
MNRQRGAALLLVLLLVSLLSIVVVEFLREARVEARTAANLRDALQAHALLRSGVAVGSALLRADARDNQVDHRGEPWADVIPPIPLGDGVLAVSVHDLYGRFPLGAVLNDRGEPLASRVEALRRLFEAAAPADADPDGLVEALVDWIDANTDGLYEDNPEHPVPNRPLTDVDELAKIEGFTPEVVAAVRPYLDVRADPKVNVNTAPVPVLHALHPDLGLERAQELYDDLTENPLDRATQLKNRSAMAGLAVTRLVFEVVVESPRFLVDLAADVRGVNRQARVILERSRAEDKVWVASWREE